MCTSPPPRSRVAARWGSRSHDPRCVPEPSSGHWPSSSQAVSRVQPMNRLLCRVFGHQWSDFLKEPMDRWGREYPSLRYEVRCARCLVEPPGRTSPSPRPTSSSLPWNAVERYAPEINQALRAYGLPYELPELPPGTADTEAPAPEDIVAGSTRLPDLRFESDAGESVRWSSEQMAGPYAFVSSTPASATGTGSSTSTRTCGMPSASRSRKER